MSLVSALGLAIANVNNKERKDCEATETVETTRQPRRAAVRCSRNVLVHTVYGGVFFCFGTTMAILGPTLIELSCLVHRRLKSMSWLFFVQALSALLGALMSGFTHERYRCNCNLILCLGLLFNGLFLAAVPLCRQLWTLILATAASGFSVGVLDTSTNVQLLTLHGRKVSPFLQALYFSYGLGAFVSPLIAEPFLTGRCQGSFLPPVRRSEAVYTAIYRDTQVTQSNPAEGLKVHYAYWFIALAHVPVVMGLLYLVIADRWEKFLARRSAEKEEKECQYEASESDGETEAQKPQHGSREEISTSQYKTQIIGITVWTSLLVFIYDGLQGTYGGYLYTYAVKGELRLSAAQGAYLTSVFWGALALGRLVSIPLALFLSPAIMLLIDVVGCLASMLLMLLFRQEGVALWIGSSTFGLFMSNVFPTSVALAEQYFTVTGTFTCFFVVSAAVGEMIIPLIVGKIFDKVGPVSFLAEGCVLCFTAVGAYIAILIMGKGMPALQQRDKELVSESDENGDITTLGETEEEEKKKDEEETEANR